MNNKERKAIPKTCLDIGSIIHTSNDPLLIFGERGVGKTTQLKKFCEDNEASIYMELESNYHSFVHIEKVLGIEEKTEKNNITPIIEEIVSRMSQSEGVFTAILDNFILDQDVKNDKYLPLYNGLINIQNAYPKKFKFVVVMDSIFCSDEILDLFRDIPCIFPIKVISDRDTIRNVFLNFNFNAEELNLCIDTANRNIQRALNLKKYIVRDWLSGEIDITAVTANFKKRRTKSYYESASEIDREILLKSSIIGIKFNSKILQDAFSVENIDESLFNVERCGYIHKIDEKNYKFDDESMPATILLTEDREKINKLNIEFSEYCLNEGIKENKIVSPKCLRRSIDYLAACKNIEKLIDVCFQLYKYYEKRNNLSMQLEIIEYFITNTPNEGMKAYYKFKKIQLLSNSEQWLKASENLRSLSDEELKYRGSTTDLYLKYHKACIDYNIGSMNDVIRHLEEISTELNKSINHLNEVEKIILCLTYSQLASSYRNRDYDLETSGYYFDKALYLSLELQECYPDLHYGVLKKCSMIYSPEKREIIEKNLETCTNYFRDSKNSMEHARTLHNLATYRLIHGDDFRSIFEQYEEAMNKMKEGNCSDISMVCNNLGILYAMNGNLQLAEDMFKGCISHANTEQFNKFTARCNLFNLCILDNRVEDAEEHYAKLKEICEKEMKSSESGFAYTVYGMISDFILEEHQEKNAKKLENILIGLKEHCRGDYFDTVFNGLCRRVGAENYTYSGAYEYPLVSNFNIKKIFFAKLRFH